MVDVRLLDLAVLASQSIPQMSLQEVLALIRDSSTSSLVCLDKKSEVLGGCVYRLHESVLGPGSTLCEL